MFVVPKILNKQVLRLASWIIRIIFIALITVMIVGCAYFNSFYVTNQSFKEAERLRIEGSNRTNSQYGSTVKRALRMLELYPDSRLSDDVLLILGKSYFYQGNYTEALQRLVEFEVHFPDSPMRDEARYFRALAYEKLERRLEAQILLVELSRTVTGQLRNDVLVSLLDIAYRNEEYGKVIEAVDEMLAEKQDQDVWIRSMNLKGNSLYELERFGEASEVFRQILTYPLDDDMEFNCRFKLSRCLMVAGNDSEAETIFNDMLKVGKFLDYYQDIKLELSDILVKRGDGDEANNILLEITEEKAKSPQAVEAYWRLGQYYFEDFRDLERSEEYFSKIKTARQPGNYRFTSNSQELRDEEERKITEAQNIATDLSLLKKTREAIYSGIIENRALNRYRYGELLYFSFNKSDSAKVEFEMILEETPHSEFVPKAYYILQYMELASEGMVDSISHRKLMEKVIDKYPESWFGDELRYKLGIPSQDSAYVAFINAEQVRLDRMPPSEYLPYYRAITDRFPESYYDFKSRVVIAWTLENVEKDSLGAYEIYEKMAADTVGIALNEFHLFAQDKLLYAQGFFEKKKEDVIPDSVFFGKAKQNQ